MMERRDLVGRKLSKKEAEEVIARASERSDASLDAHTDGLSVEVLREVAAEVGLDPEDVTRAATQVSMQRRTKAAELLGASTDAAVFRAFEFHLKPDALRRLEDLLREQAGAVVDGSPEAGTLSYETADGASIRVSPGRSGTSVEVSTDRSEELTGWAVGYGTLGFVGAVILSKLLGVDTLPEVLGAVLASGSAAYVGFRLHCRRLMGKWEQRLASIST